MEHFFRRPWIIVAILAVITVFFALQLPRAELDNNIVHFMPENNPARQTIRHFDDTFGERVVVFIGLERTSSTVFDRDFLMRIREFTGVVENIELVKEVDSIISTQYISGEGDSIIVADLVDADFSGTPEEISELKKRIASWDLYQGAIVSDDQTATQIIVTFNASSEEQGTPEVRRCLLEIRDTAQEMFAGFAETYVAGQPVISATLTGAMQSDLLVLIPLVIVVVLAVLFFSLRRGTFVILTLLTVVIAVIWSIGAMPLFDIALSVLCSILPVILIAVGSAYGIHIVTHYANETENRTLSVEEHRALVLSIVRRLIKPVFLAALTTFAGFVSLCFTAVIPIREFGIFASLGVVASFVVALTLIPALLLIRGPKSPAAARARTDRMGGMWQSSDFFLPLAEKKRLVIILAVLMLGVSLYGFSKVIVDNSLVAFFRDGTDVSRSDRFIQEHFGGSKQLTISVEADTTEILLSPAVLKAVDDLSVYLTEHVPMAGKVMGFTDMIKRMNQLFNIDEGPGGLRPAAVHASADTEEGGFGFDGSFDNADEDFGFGIGDGFDPSAPVNHAAADTAPESRPYAAEDIIGLLDTAGGMRANMTAHELVRELARLTNYNGFSYYEIPSDPARYAKTSSEELQRLISNYLVLLSGAIDDYSNDPLEPTAIKTAIQIHSPWQKDADTVTDAINAYVAAHFPPAKPGALPNVRVIIGGGAAAEGAVSNLIIHSQAISIVVSVLIVFAIIAVSYRSIAAGLIAVVPLSLALLFNFAVMGFLDIKINLATALISSLVVGIGIDYTIHFIEFFKQEYAAGGDFLRRTFAGTGKAIVINALSVGAGFAVLAFSRLKIIVQLGALVTLSMFITALVSLTVIPVLLTTVRPKFVYGDKE
jgi:predicted RND superfamily exporter protein